MIWFVGGILACVALAVLGAMASDRARPAWGPLRIALLVALPLPGIVLTGCGYVLVGVVRATPQQCGVDACGMAMLAASAIGAVALLAYACSVLAAWIVVRDRRRR